MSNHFTLFILHGLPWKSAFSPNRPRCTMLEGISSKKLLLKSRYLRRSRSLISSGRCESLLFHRESLFNLDSSFILGCTYVNLLWLKSSCFNLLKWKAKRGTDYSLFLLKLSMLRLGNRCYSLFNEVK